MERQSATAIDCFVSPAADGCNTRLLRFRLPEGFYLLRTQLGNALTTATDKKLRTSFAHVHSEWKKQDLDEDEEARFPKFSSSRAHARRLCFAALPGGERHNSRTCFFEGSKSSWHQGKYAKWYSGT